MKKLILPLLIVVLGSSGCARSYMIRMSNGTRITTASKPKLKGSAYYYKDAKGETHSVPQGRVREIMPLSMAKEEGSRFNPGAR